MDASELEAFKHKLLEMKVELEALETMSKTSTATVVLDQTSVGRLSRMDALQGQQMALEAERRRVAQLAQIRVALRQIESGDFGYCEDCGEEIGTGRLSVNPAASRCIACSE